MNIQKNKQFDLISLIWAQDRNNAIGLKKKIPWYIKEDLIIFRELTYNNIVIMGSVTWRFLPLRPKFLKGRLNIVISKNRDTISLIKKEGKVIKKKFNNNFLIYKNSFESALHFAQRFNKYKDKKYIIWIIGGYKIFKLSLQYANFAFITQLDLSSNGDIYAPKLNIKSWNETQYLNKNFYFKNNKILKHFFSFKWKKSLNGILYKNIYLERILDK